MTEVFEVLGRDHADFKRMLDALESSRQNSTEATGAVVAARRAVVERLIIDSSGHLAAEEQYFWPVVRERLHGGDELADEAIEQESEAKKVLDALAKLGGREPEFDGLIDALIRVCRAHIEFESTRVWPGLRKVLSPDEAQELGKKITKAKERGPTRPHPRMQPDPAVLATVGPAVAVVDKLRDAVVFRR